MADNLWTHSPGLDLPVRIPAWRTWCLLGLPRVSCNKGIPIHALHRGFEDQPEAENLCITP